MCHKIEYQMPCNGFVSRKYVYDNRKLLLLISYLQTLSNMDSKAAAIERQKKPLKIMLFCWCVCVCVCVCYIFRFYVF